MKGLQSVYIFQKLTREELDELNTIAHKEQFPADKVVFFQGDRSDTLYVILSGSVRIFQTSLDGKEKTISTMGPGTFFGEMAMLDGEARLASVSTNEDTMMLAIGHREFRAFVAKNPQVMWKVLESLCDRLRKTNQELHDMTHRDVPFRLTRKLVDLAKEHGEQRLDGLRIGIKLTPDVLAPMVGTDPQQISRLITRYQDDQLVRREGDYLLIVDVKALERSLEYEKDWA